MVSNRFGDGHYCDSDKPMSAELEVELKPNVQLKLDENSQTFLSLIANACMYNLIWYLWNENDN